VIVVDQRHQYCKIFVNAADPEPVREMLGRLLGGTFGRRDMYVADLVVSVLPNSDAAGAHDREDDFVRWPLLVEAEAEQPATARHMVETTRRILAGLWDSGRPAVAACDFEDDLPWHGGIDGGAELGSSRTAEE
jgi:hypothetical protein